MVSLMALWLPILVAAGIVFVASSILHMVLPYHQSDFGKLPSENEVMAALRKFKIPPGEYMVPCAGSQKAMKSPDFIEKMNKGPVAMMTVMPSGRPSIRASLTQ